MYRAAVRWMIRRNIAALDRGHHGALLRMFAADAVLAFPGDNSWSNQFRVPASGGSRSPLIEVAPRSKRS